MKIYKYKGRRYWFDPENAPKGAVEVVKKEAAPKNKKRKTRSKKAPEEA